MRDVGGAKRVRLAPVVMTALFALASLKAAGLWLTFSSAGAEDAATSPPAPVLAAPAGHSVTSERLLEQLAARKEELDAREAELDTRESVLKAAELRIEASIKSLRREKEEIALAESNRKQDRADEIGRLSDAYERMKPRDAARVFEALDADILIPVAAGMRTQSLAAVLAEMSSEKATALTVALAHRAAETPPADAGAQ